MYKQIIKDLEEVLENYNPDQLENDIVALIGKYQAIVDGQPLKVNSRYGVDGITTMDSWDSKRDSVIFVEKQEHIDIIFKALVAQDDYWEDYKDIIKVLPEEQIYIGNYTVYCGKTDIYNVGKLRQDMLDVGVKFLIYQDYPIDNE